MAGQGEHNTCGGEELSVHLDAAPPRCDVVKECGKVV